MSIERNQVRSQFNVALDWRRRWIWIERLPHDRCRCRGWCGHELICQDLGRCNCLRIIETRTEYHTLCGRGHAIGLHFGWIIVVTDRVGRRDIADRIALLDDVAQLMREQPHTRRCVRLELVLPHNDMPSDRVGLGLYRTR
jgi:hypothetical protein